MILGAVEVLDNGFIFTDNDGVTHGCVNTESLAEELRKCMSTQTLFRSKKGEKYIFEMNQVKE